MRKVLPGFFAFMVVALILNLQAFAHTLFMTVEDNEDGTVTVQGMFSTGAVGAWVEVRLEDEKGKVLWKKDRNSQRSEVRGQKSEVRSQPLARREVRNQKSVSIVNC